MKKLFYYLLIVIPGLIGTYGLWLNGLPLNEAAFNSLSMYVINYMDPSANIFVEIARWLAPLFLSVGVAYAFKAVEKKVHNWNIYRKGSSVAVLGNDDLVEQLGKNAIVLEDEFVKANKYVFSKSEAENIEFYKKYKDKIDKIHGEVFLKYTTINPTLISENMEVNLYNEEDIASRIYWKQRSIFNEACHKEFNFKVCLIGFGELGENLLYHGLIQNVFHKKQNIEYHVCGDMNSFKMMHHELDQVTDKIYEYKGLSEIIGSLKDMDRIIVLDQDNQMEIVGKLLYVTEGISFDVFVSDKSNLDFFQGQNDNDKMESRLYEYDWTKIANTLSNIIDEESLNMAKAFNYSYSNEELSADVAWKKLTFFTRYSNISCTDYIEQAKLMVSQYGWGFDYDSWTDEQKDFMGELEHLRWCRYHYLNNFKYAIPSNGKSKDEIMRIHTCLVDYDQLSEELQGYDKKNIQLYMTL